MPLSDKSATRLCPRYFEQINMHFSIYPSPFIIIIIIIFVCFFVCQLVSCKWKWSQPVEEPLFAPSIMAVCISGLISRAALLLLTLCRQTGQVKSIDGWKEFKRLEQTPPGNCLSCVLGWWATGCKASSFFFEWQWTASVAIQCNLRSWDGYFMPQYGYLILEHTYIYLQYIYISV